MKPRGVCTVPCLTGSPARIAKQGALVRESSSSASENRADRPNFGTRWPVRRISRSASPVSARSMRSPSARRAHQLRFLFQCACSTARIGAVSFQLCASSLRVPSSRSALSSIFRFQHCELVIQYTVRPRAYMQYASIPHKGVLLGNAISLSRYSCELRTTVSGCVKARINGEQRIPLPAVCGAGDDSERWVGV